MSAGERVPASSTNGAAIKVLYIVGESRSGSTVLDNLLGALDGFFSAGELFHFWKRGLIQERLCGCGEPPRRCLVWSSVLGELFGDPAVGEVHPREVVRWQDETVRIRHTWKLLRHTATSAGRDPALAEYVKITSRLYRALTAVTRARVIVDSSKNPARGAVVRLAPGIDPYYVHLVRDPRAVAYSYSRRKTHLDKGRHAEMGRKSPTRSTLSWVGVNIASEALLHRHRSERSLRVRYEDFIARPRDTLALIAELVGERPRDFPLGDDHIALLPTNHTVSGNPSRFRTGRVELRQDIEWLTKQRRADVLAATALALPLLHRYSYAVAPRARRDVL